MVAKKSKRPPRKAKSLPARKLTADQAKGVKGGFVKKHIGQPKYQDITVNSGAGMAKEYYSWKP